MIIHPKLTEKENGKRNPPSPYDLKGGSEWYNSGKCMITVHRENHEYNEADIIFHKIKPRSNGEVGNLKIKFDKATLCYYFDSLENNRFVKVFASEEKQEIKPKQPESIIDKDGQSALNWGGGLMSASEKIRLANENPF